MNLSASISILSGGQGSGRHPGAASPTATTLAKVKTIANRYGLKYKGSSTFKGLEGHPDEPSKRHEHTFAGRHSELTYRSNHEWIHRGAHDRVVGMGFGLADLEKNLRKQLGVIHSGGPGSGCHGDHCGRPKKGTSEDINKFKNPRKKGFSKKAGAALYGKPKAPRVDKALEKRAIPSTAPQQPFSSGDKVVLKEAIPRAKGISKAGEEAYVENVLPKVGTEPQIYSIKYRNGYIGYATHDQLARPLPDTIQQKPELQPLEGNRVKQSWVRPDGARFTEYYPSKKGTEERETGPRDPFKQASSLKGRFTKDLNDVYSGNRITSIFSATPASEAGTGATVFVHRYTGSGSDRSVSIQEIRTGKFGWQSGLLREYKFSGKQAFTQAARLTKARYGFSLQLPKAGW